MIWAVVIEVDGSIREIDHKPELKELQDAVGGWIELVVLDGGAAGFCNEEGKLKGLPLNVVGTSAMRFGQASMGPSTDYIAGPLVVMGDADREGESTAIKEDWLLILRGLSRKRHELAAAYGADLS